MMMTEVYDAFLAAGAPDEKARKAAEALSSHDQRIATKSDLSILEKSLEARLVKIDGEMLLLKWMLGTLLAGVASLVIRAFWFMH
jgi:hypothetical protein